MPRRRVPQSSTLPYHITARCINREWFAKDLKSIWTIYEDHLFFAHHSFKMNIAAFVLMPNHFHMLSLFPEGNMSACMNHFMRETSRAMTRATGRINHTYGSRYFRSQISTDAYLTTCTKYIYRNPVRAGLCTRVQDYPFSTIGGLLGAQKLIIPVTGLHPFRNADVETTLQWLNTDFAQKENVAIAKALRKCQFKFGSDK